MADIYNKLPSLREADVLFVDRDDIFRAAAALLARFNFDFGLCLVHAHCKLEQGEIMLARGNITQPEWENGVSDEVFPERWLATGQAYEFTTRPTKTPPPELFQELSKMSGDTCVLGLYHIDRDESKESKKMMEHTEGRQNILWPSEENPTKAGLREFDAAWDIKNADLVHSTCKPTTVCLEDTDGTHVGTMDFHLGYDKDAPMLEYSEGRKNILRPYVESDICRGSTQINTAWNFARPDPTTNYCRLMMICDWGYDEDDNLQHLGKKKEFHMPALAVDRPRLKSSDAN